MSTLGQRIIKIRGDLTLDEFARKLSKSGFKFEKGALSKYENGIVNPSYNFFLAIHKTFNVNLNWLITGEGFMKNDDNESIMEENKKLKEENTNIKKVFLNEIIEIIQEKLMNENNNNI